MSEPFETTSVRMRKMLLLTFQAPPEDVDRIMASVVARRALKRLPPA